MTKLYNKIEYKNVRRILRAQSAEVSSEKIFWKKVRNKYLGVKFRRQHGIGPYIVDFYCPELRLIVEIDGATHVTDDELRKDKERQDYLEREGFCVKRYLNNDIKNNLSEVVGDLQNIIKGIRKTPPNPPLAKGME